MATPAADVLDHALPAPPSGGSAGVGLVADVPRYTEVDGVHVAYGVYGDGPVDVLLINPTFIPIDVYLEESHLAAAVTGPTPTPAWWRCCWTPSTLTGSRR
jgi:hypothetical protein